MTPQQPSFSPSLLQLPMVLPVIGWWMAATLNLNLARWISFHLAPLIHLGSLHWRGVLEGWALSKILAYDWINHLSVIDVPNTVGRRAKTSFPPTKAFRAVLWCSFKEIIFARLDNTDEMPAAIVVGIKAVASPLCHVYKNPARGPDWLYH